MSNLILNKINDPAKKIDIIRMIRIVTRCDLPQAKEYYDTVINHGQFVVLPVDCSDQQAEEYRESFFALGVDVTLDWDWDCGNADSCQLGSSSSGNADSYQQDSSASENQFVGKQNTEQVESSYTLFGKTIRFNSAAERYFDMLLMLWEAQHQATASCTEWYDSKHNLDALLSDGFATVKQMIIRNAVSPLYGFLKKYEIYDITLEKFTATCGSLQYSEQVFCELRQQQSQIEQIQAEEAEYRAARKAGRGRVVGGGFGMKGALKGMAEAAAINAVTGMAHSVANAVGNAGSAIGAASSKSTVYNDSNTRQRILDALKNDIIVTFISSIDLINERKGTVISYSSDAEKAKALFENAKAIPGKRAELLVQSFICCPWNDALLKYIFVNCPSERPTVSSIAERFKIDLSVLYENMLAKEYTDFARNNEDAARKAKQIIISLMQQYNITDSPTLNRLEKDCIERLSQGYETADEEACKRILAAIKAYDAKEDNKKPVLEKVQHRIEEIWSSEDGEIFDNILRNTDITDPSKIDEAENYIRSKGRTSDAEKFIRALEAFKTKKISNAQRYYQGKSKKYLYIAIIMVLFLFFTYGVSLAAAAVCFILYARDKKTFNILTIDGRVIHPVISASYKKKKN